jgi:hypothetical protein
MIWECSPLILATALFLIGGLFLLNRADTQARDTTRKHHLEDLEHALYFARNIYGTYPPYDQPTWCGFLDDADSEARVQIEEALRAQHEKYANPDKPFPTDPLLANTNESTKSRSDSSTPSYFYWKRNPATFELYSILETTPTQDRSTNGCPDLPSDQTTITYDYGITSIWREQI